MTETPREPRCSTCNDTKNVVFYAGSNDVGHTYDLPCTDCCDLIAADREGRTPKEVQT